ncbi:hypothetical protein ABZV41_43090, partial [Streptomyces sp. NPDC005098]|uniref:hypothetical protein n=1 Tax=Streptomyces sp. NPDC005098 TaxID=3154560 RepID=UPI0033AA7F56
MSLLLGDLRSRTSVVGRGAGRGTAATGAKSSRLQDVRTSPSAFRIARYVRPFTRLVDGRRSFAALLDHAAVR